VGGERHVCLRRSSIDIRTDTATNPKAFCSLKICDVRLISVPAGISLVSSGWRHKADALPAVVQVRTAEGLRDIKRLRAVPLLLKAGW
jgi:hypothetical protein